jgi:nucleoid DNA-binding protein
MDKPVSMSTKEYLIRKMSVRTNTPIKVIEAVVAHQMQGLNLAIQDDNIFTAEISGFGKFIFNYKKAEKKYEKNLSKETLFTNALGKPDISDKQRNSYLLKLENTKSWMEGIKTKLQKCPNLQNT